MRMARTWSCARPSAVVTRRTGKRTAYAVAVKSQRHEQAASATPILTRLAMPLFSLSSASLPPYQQPAHPEAENTKGPAAHERHPDVEERQRRAVVLHQAQGLVVEARVGGEAAD